MKFPATAAARLGLLWVLLWLEETSTSPIGAAASRPARNVLAGRGKAKESAAPFELRFSIVRDPNKVSFLSLSEGDGLHRLVGRNGLRVDDTSSAKLFAARDRRQAPQTSSSEATTAGGGVNDEISQAIAGALTDAFEAGKGSPAAAAGFHVNNVGVIPARDKTGYNARMQGPGGTGNGKKKVEWQVGRLAAAMAWGWQWHRCNLELKPGGGRHSVRPLVPYFQALSPFQPLAYRGDLLVVVLPPHYSGAACSLPLLEWGIFSETAGKHLPPAATSRQRHPSGDDPSPSIYLQRLRLFLFTYSYRYIDTTSW
eukprot:CAMPEP_0178998898 /NCGR_PEP_ID=MMETSP0795-20121207/9755_1 /TAXON_ID=88552 /ORGANISM="Amoebophrya sp., Strain Ameob2" /LENGTH=311 /DNA_ID=CAMNT_0020691601 /DNA_START=59 /DNA_END=992 /DNA_ORIENTATION=+